MKHLFTLVTFSLLSFQVLAQGGQITSIYVEPQNPTINDEITVYAELVFNYSAHWIIRLSRCRIQLS
jgi:hypothetical protein